MTTHKKEVRKRRMRTAKRKGNILHTRKRRARVGGTQSRPRPLNVNEDTARDNSSKVLRLENDPQMMFDKVMQFFLESVSAEDTLNNMGITRKRISNWNAFKKHIETQKKNSKPLDDSFAGIYARSFGAGSVHFYGVRKEPSGEFTVANGYPSAAGIRGYSYGLDAQPDHSHGLCQTFALMYYFGDEALINTANKNKETDEERTARYRNNIDIGLEWLKYIFLNKEIKFEGNNIQYRVGDTVFKKDYNEEIMVIGEYICKLAGKKCDEETFNLFDLADVITDYSLQPLLNTWFYT